MSSRPVVEPPGTWIPRRVAGVLFSRLARASAWLSIGAVGGGILGYVFQVVMGRMLSTQEYGVFSAMMALFAVLSAPLGTLMMVVSRRISEYRAGADRAAIAAFYRSIVVRTAAVGAPVLAAFLVFAPQVQSYLHAPGAAPVYLLGMLVLVTFLPIVNNAFLQGLQRFSWLSGSALVNALLKVCLPAALVAMGYGVAGAIGGVVLTSLATWAITYAPLRASLAPAGASPAPAAGLPIRQWLPVFVANASFAAMTQLDMVIVNHYFPPHEASLYAAASVLGKAVMYLPGGIALALFPMVAERHARNEASAHLLLQAVGLTALACGAGAIVYLFLGEWIIALLYGESYRGAGDVLKVFGFAIMPMALVYVAEHFLIAKGRVLFAYLFLAIAPLQLAAIYFWHPSLQAVVAVVGASGTLLALVGYGMLWRAYRKSFPSQGTMS